MLMGTGKKAQAEANRETLAQVATALTGIQGQQAKVALAVIEQAMRGEPVREELAQQAGRIVATILGVGAYSAKPQAALPATGPEVPSPSAKPSGNALGGWIEGNAGPSSQSENILSPGAGGGQPVRNALATLHSRAGGPIRALT
jgi:cell pole-organizing protein PopZ